MLGIFTRGAGVSATLLKHAYVCMYVCYPGEGKDVICPLVFQVIMGSWDTAPPGAQTSHCMWSILQKKVSVFLMWCVVPGTLLYWPQSEPPHLNNPQCLFVS